MKHLTTLVAFLLLSFAIYAQSDKPIKKGNILLGGNFGLGYEKNTSFYNISDESIKNKNEQKTFSVDIYPTFGFFIVDGLLVGISPNYSFRFTKQNDVNHLISNSLGVTPFIKYYFKNYLFIGFSTGYSYSIYNLKNTYLNEIINSYNLTSSFGYAIFINNKVSLEPSINYKFEKTLDKANFQGYKMDSDDHKLYFSICFSIFL